MAQVEVRGERVWRAGPFTVFWTVLTFLACFAAMGFFAYFGFVLMRDDTGIKVVSAIAILVFAVLALFVSQAVRWAVTAFMRLEASRFEFCVWDAALRLTYWRPPFFRRASVPLNAIRAVEYHQQPGRLLGMPFMMRLYSIVTADGQRLVFNGVPLYTDSKLPDQGLEAAQAIAVATGLSVVDRGTFEAGTEPAPRADASGAPSPMSDYAVGRASKAARWTWAALGLVVAAGAIMRGCSH